MLGVRVPPSGQGYAGGTVAAQSELAGFYGQVTNDPKPANDVQQRANIPTWSTLTFSDGGTPFTVPGAGVSNWRQSIDLHTGIVTTTATWTAPDGHVTDLAYQVLTDRANPSVGLVRLQFTPGWSGVATVDDDIDGTADTTATPELTTQVAKSWNVASHQDWPDEANPDVNDEVYTNVGAMRTLQDAVQAARVLGITPPPSWSAIAAGLVVPVDNPLDIHPEFSGYGGQLVKRPDVTMLQYPWAYSMPSKLAENDINYYVPRSDPGGPSMDDAINLIDNAALGTPGGASYVYTERSYEPFIRDVPATDWEPTTVHSTLTARIAGLAAPIRTVTLRWGRQWPTAPAPNVPPPPGPVIVLRPASYSVLVSSNGRKWRRVTVISGHAGQVPDTLHLSGVRARFVRIALTATSATSLPMLDELTVSGSGRRR